jgi:CO dehydrogenase nickel-insertion accessory protein CooC1
MKRITLFAGRYGSGKTNLALNYARYIKKNLGKNVAIADLDIVNPYFRTKDFEQKLVEEGISLIVSDFANSNVDLPAMPKEAYRLFADKDINVVIDVGGDDRGALALGRYVEMIKEENDYEMVAVVNASRVLTQTARETVEVLREIEYASNLKFTCIANNTNLGLETDVDVIIDSSKYAEEISQIMGIPVKMTVCPKDLENELEGRVGNIFPVDVLRLYYHLEK